MRYILVIITCFLISSRLYAQTENEIYCYMVKIGIKHPDVVLKQAIFETGHFKSQIYKKRNNLFGFRQRKYITYDNWKKCIDYYKVWQDKHYTNDSLNYYKFLENRNFSGLDRLRYSKELRNTRIKANLNCSVDDKQEK